METTQINCGISEILLHVYHCILVHLPSCLFSLSSNDLAVFHWIALRALYTPPFDAVWSVSVY
ncbi:hypothetical protein EG68_07121 [Paragonimus skrjabini miyazakii]|uniref:Uncharacterized protein n=1 Tax=Paragonimus skrjabini miyazakii TaxID=59628 RepID=A0A8S9YU55_9TREM|nr:hypothetical protein EG68_07121 [Paragonimus skrjabini miyazakii]